MDCFRVGAFAHTARQVCRRTHVWSPSALRQPWSQHATRSLSKDALDHSRSTRHQPDTLTLPPHSLLPLKMLIRSSLVSTISSKPLLLNAALKVLSFLAQTKLTVFQVGKNPLLHGILKQTLYNHFCAGENGTEVTNTIRNLKDIGFKGVILTYAKEIVVDANLEEKGKGMVESSANSDRSEDIESWREGVLETVRLLGKDDFLALKLTGAGASVMSSLSTTQSIPKQMSDALQEVCTEAQRRNVRILVDAEQQSVQSGIDAIAMELMKKYNKGKTNATVYNTYQAYLKSTPATLRTHMKEASIAGFALGVKLVRGAYMASEPRHLINDTKEDTDKSYNSITDGLISQSLQIDSSYPAVSLFLATHNKDSAIMAQRLFQSREHANQPNIVVQYGQLLGMADEVSCELLQVGMNSTPAPDVYKCLSWGSLEDCLSYLLRRARENKDAVGRSQSEYAAVWAELRRRMKSSLLR